MKIRLMSLLRPGAGLLQPGQCNGPNAGSIKVALDYDDMSPPHSLHHHITDDDHDGRTRAKATSLERLNVRLGRG